MVLGGVAGPSPLGILDDYGPVGKGASQAHYVLAENGSEYIVKGRQFSPGHAYVATTEMVTASLADFVGLPVLDHRLVCMGSELFFGSAWMPSGSFAPAVTPSLLDQCVNRDRIYEIVAFDVWVCNIDRHQENLIVRETRGRAGTVVRSLLLNDHSHCFIRPGETPAILPSRTGEPFRAEFVRLDFVRDRILDPGRLGKAVQAMEALSDASIEAVVRSVPDAFLSTAERRLMYQFIKVRRSQLRTIITDARSLFPNLAGGAI